MNRIYCLIIFILSPVSGLYIKENKAIQSDTINEEHKTDTFTDIINSWMKYKRKFQFITDSENAYALHEDRFNELEALEIIPSIIVHYRANKISQDEINVLSQIYGNLWTIMEQEAKRKPNEKMNAILKALFDSFHLTRGSTTTRNIEENNVNKFNRNINKPPQHKLLLHVNKNDHPAQRILSVAAMLIHYNRNNNNNLPNRERELNTPTETTATNEVNNALTNNISVKKIKRTKRNVNIHFTGNKLLDSSLDDLLKVTRDHVDSAESDYDEDYDDEERNFNIGADSKRSFDYLYEDNYEYSYDENVGHHPSRSSTNSDYGSFRDLIYLAAKHRLRREREETKLKGSRQFFLN